MARQPITWKNINQPNFDASNRLQQVSLENVQNALVGGGDIAKGIRDEERLVNTNKFRADLQGLSSVDDYNAAVQEGRFGPEATGNIGGANQAALFDAMANREKILNQQEATAATRALAEKSFGLRESGQEFNQGFQNKQHGLIVDKFSNLKDQQAINNALAERKYDFGVSEAALDQAFRNNKLGQQDEQFNLTFNEKARQDDIRNEQTFDNALDRTTMFYDSITAKKDAAALLVKNNAASKGKRLQLAINADNRSQIAFNDTQEDRVIKEGKEAHTTNIMSTLDKAARGTSTKGVQDIQDKRDVFNKTYGRLASINKDGSLNLDPRVNKGDKDFANKLQSDYAAIDKIEHPINSQQMGQYLSDPNLSNSGRKVLESRIKNLAKKEQVAQNKVDAKAVLTGAAEKRRVEKLNKGPRIQQPIDKKFKGSNRDVLNEFLKSTEDTSQDLTIGDSNVFGADDPTDASGSYARKYLEELFTDSNYGKDELGYTVDVRPEFLKRAFESVQVSQEGYFGNNAAINVTHVKLALDKIMREHIQDIKAKPERIAASAGNRKEIAKLGATTLENVSPENAAKYFPEILKIQTPTPYKKR